MKNELNKKELLQDLSFVFLTWKRHYPHTMKVSRFLRIWKAYDQLKELIKNQAPEIVSLKEIIRWINK